MAKKSEPKLFVFNDEFEPKCKLSDELFGDLLALEQNEIKFLILSALIGEEGNWRFNEIASRFKGISGQQRKAIVEKLRKLGYFLEGGYSGYWRSEYIMAPEKLVSVILYGLDRCPDLVQEIKNRIVVPDKRSELIWKLVQECYDGTDMSIYRDLDLHKFFRMERMLVPFLGTDFLNNFVSALQPISFVNLLRCILDKLYLDDLATQESALGQCWSLCELYFEKVANREAQSLCFDYICLNEFVFTGCCKHSFSSKRNYVQVIIRAIQKLYQGKDSESLALFAEALKEINKMYDLKNVIHHQLLCFYLLLCYAKSGEVKKTSAFVKKEQVKTNLLFTPALLVAQMLVLNDTSGEPAKYIKKLLEYKESPVSQSFGALFAKFDATLGIRVPADIENRVVNCALLRYEMSAMGEKCADYDVLRERLGGEPIFTSFKAKPKWELLLDSLMAKGEEEKESSSQEKRAERLVYVVRENYNSEKEVYPQRQKLLKSGKWGKPFSVSVNSFLDKKIECLDQSDLALLKSIKGKIGYYYYDSLPCDLIVSNLVGSDKVYYYNKKRDEYESIEVIAEKPYIQFEKQANKFAVTSNVPLKIKDGKLDDAIVTWNGDTQAIVYQLTEFERSAIYQLLQQKKFPLEAEKQLQEFIYAVDKKLEVHSDLVQGGSLLDKKKAATTITLRLDPKGDECLLQVYVVPCEGSKLRLFPGRGMAVIYDEIDGKRCQVERNLKAEKEYFELLQVNLMESVGSHIESGETMTLDIEMMLKLLDFVREHSDIYQVEWPENRSYKLRGLQDKTTNSIRVVSNENWFEVEGELKLDEKKKLSLSELLRLMQEGQVGTRFVRLGDDEFLALSDSLAKQLQKLERIAQVDSKKVRINRLQVGELAKIVQAPNAAIKSDSSVQTLADEIKQAANMQVALPRGLQAQLRDYQQIGYEWMSRLASWGAGACLADDMGLGKTVQAIAFLLQRAKQGPSMVVAPTSVVFNWQKELNRFAPTLNVHIFNEASDRAKLIEGLKNNDILLTSYGLIVREEETIKAKKWNVVCLDEAHTIKNRATKMSQVAMELQSQARLLLTGTPVQNHLGELWNLFQFLNPGLLGSFEWFNKRYIQPIESQNEERRAQLRKLVQPFILRRTKGEVVEELPDKIEMTRQVELADEELVAYEALRQEAQQSLEEENKVSISVLSNITRLREAACSLSLVDKKWQGGSSKLDDMSSLVSQIVEEGNRVLIFSQFTSFLTQAKAVVDKMGIESFYLDGSTTMQKRKKMVEQFQEGEKSVFFISLKAGGLGLNLTGANYVIHLDPWWNPAIEQQATDRAYRIGQDQKVTVYHLIAKNTIEEKILRLHQSKRDIADSILDGTNVSHALNLDDLRYLLEM